MPWDVPVVPAFLPPALLPQMGPFPGTSPCSLKSALDTTGPPSPALVVAVDGQGSVCETQ